MRVRSKYKVARRLGAHVFDKTQTPKFALNEEKKFKKFRRQPSDYGKQLIEKQKVRYTYNLSEKQFRAYVKQASEQNKVAPSMHLYNSLERRLDNIVYRLGFAPTRQAARQMVVHGHITVDGQRLSRPSYQVKNTNAVSIRVASQGKALFAELKEKAGLATPTWLTYDAKEIVGTITADPAYISSESFFELETVVQFYNR